MYPSFNLINISFCFHYGKIHFLVLQSVLEKLCIIKLVVPSTETLKKVCLAYLKKYLRQNTIGFRKNFQIYMYMCMCL